MASLPRGLHTEPSPPSFSSSSSSSSTLNRLVQAVDALKEEQKAQKATLVAIYDLVLSIAKHGGGGGGSTGGGNDNGMAAVAMTSSGTNNTIQVAQSRQESIHGLARSSEPMSVVENTLAKDSVRDIELPVRLETRDQVDNVGENGFGDDAFPLGPTDSDNDFGLPCPPPPPPPSPPPPSPPPAAGADAAVNGNVPQEISVNDIVGVSQPQLHVKQFDEEEKQRKRKEKEEEERRKRLDDERKRQEEQRKRQEEERKRQEEERKRQEEERKRREEETKRREEETKRLEKEAKRLEEEALKAAEMKRLDEEIRRQRLIELKKRKEEEEMRKKLEQEEAVRIIAQSQMEAKRKKEIELRKQREAEIERRKNIQIEKARTLEQEELRKHAQFLAKRGSEQVEKDKKTQQIQQERTAIVESPKLSQLPMKRDSEQMSAPVSPVTRPDATQVSSPVTPNGGLNGRLVHAGGTVKREKLSENITTPEMKPAQPKSNATNMNTDETDAEIAKLDASTAYSMALQCREIDPERCLRLLHHAASLAPNESAITHALACVLLKGTPSTHADAKGAIELLKSNVSVHHVDSMLTLAEILRTGRPQDNMARQPEDAARLCEAVLEIEPNNTSAMVMRGNLYREQKDPPPTDEDETMAYKLYSRAASLGSIDGVYQKGYWLVTMAPHHRKARQAFEGKKLVEQAADKGHGGALFFLGHCYEFPDRYWKGLFDFTGDQLSYEKLVYHYYKRAAEAGHGDALNNVGSSICAAYAGLKPDFDLARSYYERAIEAGSRDGYDNLAMLYETGMDARYPERISFTNALNYYRLGAKRDIPQCLMHLGNAHEDGLGTLVKKDRRKAEKYYRKALRLAREYEEEYAENQTNKDLQSLYLMNTRIATPEEAARSKKALGEMISAKSCNARVKDLDNALYAAIYENGSTEPLEELVGESNAVELLDFAKTQVERANRGEDVDLTQLFGRRAKPGSKPVIPRSRKS